MKNFDELSDKEKQEEFKKNNPDNLPVGHFTGRCPKCGSLDLWDDNLHYGCNNCKTILA